MGGQRVNDLLSEYGLYTTGMMTWGESTGQYRTVQVQYNTVEYCTVQYRRVQYSTIQYSTIQHNTVEYSTVQYLTLCDTVQYFRPKSSFLSCINHIQREDRSPSAPSYVLPRNPAVSCH